MTFKRFKTALEQMEALIILNISMEGTIECLAWKIIFYFFFCLSICFDGIILQSQLQFLQVTCR